MFFNGEDAEENWKRCSHLMFYNNYTKIRSLLGVKPIRGNNLFVFINCLDLYFQCIPEHPTSCTITLGASSYRRGMSVVTVHICVDFFSEGKFFPTDCWYYDV